MDYSYLFSELEWLNLKDTKLLIGKNPVQIFINTAPEQYIVEIYLSEVCIFSVKVADMIHLDVLKRFLLCLFNVEKMTV